MCLHIKKEIYSFDGQFEREVFLDSKRFQEFSVN